MELLVRVDHAPNLLAAEPPSLGHRPDPASNLRLTRARLPVRSPSPSHLRFRRARSRRSPAHRDRPLPPHSRPPFRLPQPVLSVPEPKATPAPVPPPPAPPPLRLVPEPPPRTMFAEFDPVERIPATVLIVWSVDLISSPVSPFKTSLSPPYAVVGLISPWSSVWFSLPFRPSFPSAPAIFCPPPCGFLSCAPGSFTPEPPPDWSPGAAGGGGCSISARWRPKRAAYSSGLTSSSGFSSAGGVLRPEDGSR